MWAGLLTGGLPCGLLFALGLAGAELISQLALYAVLVLLYLGLVLAICTPSPLSRWIWRHLWAFLLVIGLLCLGIQSLVAESFLQPIVFLVPLDLMPRWRTRRAGSRRSGLFFLGLMNLGIWFGGQDDPIAFLFPTFGYGTFMIFTYAFVQLSIQQASARREADRLAADLAHQRDYMARLIDITATLTRDLDLATVLEQVAAEGRSLAHAAQVRVWLLDNDSDQTGGTVRLAAAVPPSADTDAASWGSDSIEQLAATVSGTRLVLPLIAKGATIGALELHDSPQGPFTSEDARLLQPFANAAAVAIENARLYEQSRLSATLSERNRLARELHDTIAQG